MNGTDFDIAIVGSGFGGSLLAMIARRLGFTVALLERGTHPRFAIGESTSPLTNLLIEELARRYDLPRLLPLTTYGAWQRTYPEIRCGLKRGFTFFGHAPGKPYRSALDRSNQLLVAASPHDDLADTHWLRADVDQFLLREAVALGADYQDAVTLDAAVPLPSGGGMTLTGSRHDRPLRLHARLVVDASGPRGFLARALNLPETTFPGYPATQSLFSHFTDVRRCDAMDAFFPNETQKPPFPADDAAVHHVFPGGWMWLLRFNNGVTSAGVAMTDGRANELDLAEGNAAAWQRFLDRFPTIAEQFAQARPIQPFRYAPRLSYRVNSVAGPGWALLPSAAAFVDPLFSPGFPLTLLGIERLTGVLQHGLEGWDNAARAAYARATLGEADHVARFVAGCYAGFDGFASFAALSMFYFAAASFSEMARRLGKPHLAHGFLLANHPTFRSGLESCCDAAAETYPAALRDAVRRAVEPVNVAGLCDDAKRNWYGVDLEDVVRGASKLDRTPGAVREIIANAPWAQIPLAAAA